MASPKMLVAVAAAAVAAALLQVSSAVPLSAFVSYGVRSTSGYTDDSALEAGDDSNSVSLMSPNNVAFPFFSTAYSNVYININGLVSFDQAVATYTPDLFTGEGYAAIAPFWADVDTRADFIHPSTTENKVYYSFRDTTGDTETLQQVNTILLPVLHGATFVPTYLLVVTWLKVSTTPTLSSSPAPTSRTPSSSSSRPTERTSALGPGMAWVGLGRLGGLGRRVGGTAGAYRARSI